MQEDVNYRKMKQKYLREQIMAQEFDAQEFADHLGTKKEGGKLIRN